MDKKVTEYFTDVIISARSVFEHVEYKTDITPERSILRLQGRYGLYQVLVTELFSDRMRKYRYYVLRENRVEAGFDNSPDPRAIRLRYGRIGSEHAGEYIPHLHLEDKTQMILTEEMTFAGFIDWLETNIVIS
ncbi:MAG: hypothetical protein GY749_47145 [Desulfobacteraceae bacterium]|nr:hypothetical protein [Desulfobacteraceae bacterium]